MTSSRRLDYTAEARKDLRAILRYTRKVWGERQRDIYARLLTSAIEELTRYLFIGEERDDIPAEMRAKPAKQHVIFYRVDDQAVTIIRLLHAKMDTASRLRWSKVAAKRLFAEPHTSTLGVEFPGSSPRPCWRVTSLGYCLLGPTASVSIRAV